MRVMLRWGMNRLFKLKDFFFTVLYGKSESEYKDLITKKNKESKHPVPNKTQTFQN